MKKPKADAFGLLPLRKNPRVGAEDFVIAGNERTMGRAKRARGQRRRKTKAGKEEGGGVVDAKETVLRSFGGGR